MKKPSEDEIRQRAHELWEENHRPDNRDEEFWHQAERELQAAAPGTSPAKETPESI